MIEVPGGWVLEPGEETPSIEAFLARMTPEQIAEAEARMGRLRELEATFEGDPRAGRPLGAFFVLRSGGIRPYPGAPRGDTITGVGMGRGEEST